MMSNETNNIAYDERLTGDPRRSGGGRMPPNIEERVANLEKGMAVVDTKLDNITENYATKADLKETQLSMIKWFIATAAALAGLIVAASGLIISMIK